MIGEYGRELCGTRAEPKRLRRVPSLFAALLLATLAFVSAVQAGAPGDSTRAGASQPDTLQASPSDSASPSLLRRLYGVLWLPFRFGAHQLTVIDSTLSVSPDSTSSDSTLFGRVGGGMLYVSRKAYEQILEAYTRGTAAAEAERVAQIRDFFLRPESPWGWYPVVVGASSWRFKLGAKVYYSSPRVGSSLDAEGAGKDIWAARFRFTLRALGHGQVRQMNVTLMQRQDDDMLFYGIGPYPRTDPRSHFRPGAIDDNAVFNQDFQQAQTILALRATPIVEARGTWIYQVRHIYGPWEEDNGLQQVFDVQALPGALGRQRDLYQELALRVDNTRGQERRGVAVEVYGGLDAGVGGDTRRFLRYGLDAYLNAPLFAENMIVPRVVANVVRNLNAERPLNFTDYPRHPTFRGVPDRYLLRSDNLVFVPSLDIHNRISDRFTGRLFVDYLLVAPAIDRIHWRSGITAVGAGLVFYTPFADVAGLVFAWSPVGPRVTVFLGAEPNRNERSRWR